MSSDRPVAAHAPWAEGWAPPAPVKPLRVPARVVTVLLVASMVAGAGSLYGGVLLVTFVQDAMVGVWHPAMEDRAASIYAVNLVVAIVDACVMLGAVVAFIVWFYRCRFNAGLFAPDGNRMGQGWSIGAWFVPVVHLWFPKKIANDIWRASSPPGIGEEEYEASRTVVNLWWGAWLAAELLQRPGAVMDDGAAKLDGIRNAAVLGMGVDVLFVLAAVAAIAFVRRLTAMQEARAAERETAYLQAPPAWHGPAPDDAAWR